MTTPDPRLSVIVRRLDRWRWVPTAVLDAIVSRDDGCVRTVGDPPFWLTYRMTDGQLAVRVCADCGQPDACLELDLRTAGPNTVGVWGGLSEQDRRTLYPLWLARRDGGDGDA